MLISFLKLIFVKFVSDISIEYIDFALPNWPLLVFSRRHYLLWWSISVLLILLEVSIVLGSVFGILWVFRMWSDMLCIVNRKFTLFIIGFSVYQICVLINWFFFVKFTFFCKLMQLLLLPCAVYFSIILDIFNETKLILLKDACCVTKCLLNLYVLIMQFNTRDSNFSDPSFCIQCSCLFSDIVFCVFESWLTRILISISCAMGNLHFDLSFASTWMLDISWASLI